MPKALVLFVLAVAILMIIFAANYQPLRVIANGVKQSRERAFCLDCFVPRSDAKRQQESPVSRVSRSGVKQNLKFLK
jgi:hypothetical protein